MQWCKLHNNFRNTPAMKAIAGGLGERGVVAAYRLLEVMTEQCGSGDNYNPVLVLEPPRTLGWLAGELFIPDFREPYGGTPTNKETQEILQSLAGCGLIHLGVVECPRIFRAEDQDPLNFSNARVQNIPFLTIELIDFEESVDEWTARKRKAITQAMADSGKKKVTLGTKR